MEIKVGDIINNHKILHIYRDVARYNRIFYEVKCIKCGNVKNVQKSHVKTQGCKKGPCNVRHVDFTGRKFGDLIVLRFVNTNNKTDPWRWECKCKCGTILFLSTGTLNCGQKSCRACATKYTTENNRLPKGEAGFNEVFRQYKYSAKKRDYEFTLSKKEFRDIIYKPCYYCGEPPSNDFFNIYRNGVDRIDNTKGYTLQNSVPCCTRCNLGKHNLTKQEFYEWIKKVYENSKDWG